MASHASSMSPSNIGTGHQAQGEASASAQRRIVITSRPANLSASGSIILREIRKMEESAEKEHERLNATIERMKAQTERVSEETKAKHDELNVTIKKLKARATRLRKERDAAKKQAEKLAEDLQSNLALASTHADHLESQIEERDKKIRDLRERHGEAPSSESDSSESDDADRCRYQRCDPKSLNQISHGDMQVWQRAD